MAKLRIPVYPDGGRLPVATLLRAILQFDQFDDWLPDPVYYEDQRLYENAAVRRIEQLWASRELASPTTEPISIPRASGDSIPIVNLPLDARVCAHGVIAAMAPRISRKLVKDKVYGFGFHGGEARLFSQPGDELDELFEQVIMVALYGGAQSEPFTVLDVVGFNRKATFPRLELVLEKSGARFDEIEFVRQLVRPGPLSLPSIDDAFAFLYNFYLQPVDQSLADKKSNFFRYRDEYFVFDAQVRQFVESQLQALLGLGSRVTASPNLDVKSELRERLAMAKQSEVEKSLGKIAGGELIATYACTTWEDEAQRFCRTDAYEVKYKGVTDVDAVKELFRLPAKGGALDGVQILPLLRAIHRRRREGVHLRPPFVAGTDEFVRFCNNLVEGRAWLNDALAVALKDKVDWQVVWIAPLLSDLGPLQAHEITLLRQVLASTSMSGPAKIQTRLALARSSALKPEQFWVDTGNFATQHELRATLLGARYLVSRGYEGAWLRLATRARQEPELRDFLSENVKSTHR